MSQWRDQLNDHRRRIGLEPIVREQVAPKRNTRSKTRPGHMLGTAIRLVTGEQAGGGCACNDRRRLMDTWGWWGCWKRRGLIAGWLVEEAEKRGHAISGSKALGLLRAAIREVRGSSAEGSASTAGTG